MDCDMIEAKFQWFLGGTLNASGKNSVKYKKLKKENENSTNQKWKVEGQWFCTILFKVCIHFCFDAIQFSTECIFLESQIVKLTF